MPLLVHGEVTVVRTPQVFMIANDPERIVLSTAVAAFRPRRKEGESDYFHDLTIFTKHGSRLTKITKGDVIILRGGSLVTDQYQHNGQNRTSTKIECYDRDIAGPFSRVDIKERQSASPEQPEPDPAPRQSMAKEPREAPKAQNPHTNTGPMTYGNEAPRTPRTQPAQQARPQQQHQQQEQRYAPPPPEDDYDDAPPFPPPPGGMR